MSGFFNIIGIPETSAEVVKESFGGLCSKDGDGVALFKCPSGSTVVFADTILNDSEGVASELSAAVSSPVILLFYAEDVVWGYNLFKAGQEVDRYSSRPNYWGELTREEYVRESGDASKVADVWPNLDASQISAYLIDKEKVSEKQRTQKAYADDEHEIWDGWQVADFMRKLSLSFPFDDDGELVVDHLVSMTVGTTKGLAEKADQEARSKAFDEVQKYCKESGRTFDEIWAYYQEHGNTPKGEFKLKRNRL
ncbi:MAG: hypothetical protein ACSHYB_19645 [Roseibacillus sp.]